MSSLSVLALAAAGLAAAGYAAVVYRRFEADAACWQPAADSTIDRDELHPAHRAALEEGDDE